MDAAADQPNDRHPPSRPRREARWLEYTLRSRAALCARFACQRELSPTDVAHTVASVLPRRLGRWLLRRLGCEWLSGDAIVPFDVISSPRTPLTLRGRARPLAELALFGLPGQGLSSREKHREALYQQFCSEIMRSAVDTNSLEAAAARVLAHPETSADAVLLSMLRAFVAERQSSLRVARATPDEEHRVRSEASKLQQPFATGGYPTRSELQSIFARHQSEFEAALAQFEQERAQRALERLRTLRKRFPVHIPGHDLQACEEHFDRFLKQAATYRRQIGELAAQGMTAAAQGDHHTATWIEKRLFAIHTLLPVLLPREQLEALRGQITQSGDAAESVAVRQELLEQERAVADDIKKLAGTIHNFHQLAAKAAPDDPVLLRAAGAYRAAVERIRALDTGWLAGLILQLEALIEDLDDPGSALQHELDAFIIKVRTALNRLRVEIRTIQVERRAAATRDTNPPAPP